MNELKIIQHILDCAEPHGLIPEVVWSALKTMKDNPSLTPEEAMVEGAEEWDVDFATANPEDYYKVSEVAKGINALRESLYNNLKPPTDKQSPPPSPQGP